MIIYEDSDKKNQRDTKITVEILNQSKKGRNNFEHESKAIYIAHYFILEI